MTAEKPNHSNLLLDAIPEGERQRILDRGREVKLKQKDVLFLAGTSIATVHFPLSGMASFVTEGADGLAVEAIAVGSEGIVGLPVFLDDSANAGNSHAICQIDMEAIAVDARDFMDVADRSSPLRRQLHAFAQGCVIYASQSALCNRSHPLAQRCARWLLDSADRAGPKFGLTQEFMAHMLGVHRPSVTIAINTLEEAGLVDYERGRVTIVNRSLLQEASCECYRVVRSEFERLLGSGYPPARNQGDEAVEAALLGA